MKGVQVGNEDVEADLLLSPTPDQGWTNCDVI